MWIFMNDSFVSIVEDKTDPANLMVRARRKGDIENAFPGHRGRFLQRSDYAYRASIPRQEVADFVHVHVTGIGYTNFKDSVPKKDHERHSFYLRVWSVMLCFQRRRKGDQIGLPYNYEAPTHFARDHLQEDM